MAGDKWELVCPHSQQVTHTYANARDLWDSLLEIRELTGEPYLWFIDVANEHLPEAQKLKGLRNRGSNLCSEISLATSPFRTAVCCLSSVNLEKWPEWRDTNLVQDMVVFLDNVIEWFLHFAPPELERAYTSAQAERAIGIGAMGWSYYLMRMGIPFGSGGGVQTAIAKAAYVFSFGDPELAQRMYDYASQHYTFYSSPIFSNAPEGEWMANYTCLS